MSATKKTASKKDAKKPVLHATRENRGAKLTGADVQAMNAYCKKYMQFISTSKTEREANDNAITLLEKQGAKPLSALIKAGKVLKPGTLFYVSQCGKTLLAGRIGTEPLARGMRLVGGHTDVPHLDLKPVPLYEDSQICLLDTHYYGGVKKYQWVTLPLAMHGTIAKKDGSVLRVIIGEDPSDPVFYISDLLPHLAREQNGKTLPAAIPGENLNALCGITPVAADDIGEDDCKQAVKLNVLRFLNDKYGITEEDFVSAELALVPAGCAREVGFDRSMIMAFGHDDRVCAYAGLEAMLNAPSVKYTSVVLLCDKEEIGSVSATGMQSYFFENTIARLCALQHGNAYNDLMLRDCLEYSAMLSADVCALHDPNYPSVSSPNNMAQANGGLAVAKYLGSGGKSGSNDASAEFVAHLRNIFDNAGVMWQSTELGKVDEGGGGTIAIYMAKYGMDVIDCGVGLFSMHAPWEVCTKLDAYMAYKGYRAFLEDRA